LQLVAANAAGFGMGKAGGEGQRHVAPDRWRDGR